MAESKSKEGEKKSSKKLILIIALILLLVGGAAAYYFMYKPTGTESQDIRAKEVAENNQKDSGKQEEAEPEFYYELAEPLVVNFPAGSSAKIIKVALSVLVTEEASVESLKKHEPMIRNNLLMVISSIGADKVKTLEGKQELRAMMLTEIGKVLEKMTGKNTAKDVFFTEFVMQ